MRRAGPDARRVALVMLAAFSCGPKLTSPAVIATRTAPSSVHATTTAFRDGSGRQLLFRGYNAKINGIFDATFSDGRAPNETFPDFDEASATKFEELGFDALRLPINWSALEPTPRAYSDAFFAKVDAVLDMAQRHHFYVILDMHQDAYSKEIGEDGAPFWAIVPKPAVLLSGPSDDSRRTSSDVLAAGFAFFDNAQATDGRALQDAFISAVATMVKRYLGNTAVLGFEAFNEPVILRQSDLDAFHARFADALHTIDADAPILFEPNATRNEFDRTLVPTAPFLHGPGAYAVHLYTGIFSNVGDWQSDPALLTPSMSNALAEASAWQTPMFVTEYGCDQSNAAGPTWMEHELDLQDAALASSTAWAWEPGAWGIRYDDGTDPIAYRAATVRVVSRPYPRAVAGDLVSMERPSPDRLVVHYCATAQTASFAHEVSASPDYFADYTLFCDGNPAQNVVRELGRASFTCPASSGDHTFEIRGTLAP